MEWGNCYKCKNPIEKSGVVVCNHIYHLKCFAKTKFGKKIEREFQDYLKTKE